MAKARIDALKAPVKLAERMVDVTHCEKRLRAIALKEKGTKHIEILLTNIPASVCTAEGIIAEYRNRWCIEVFFKKRRATGNDVLQLHRLQPDVRLYKDPFRKISARGY